MENAINRLRVLTVILTEIGKKSASVNHSDVDAMRQMSFNQGHQHQYEVTYE